MSEFNGYTENYKTFSSAYANTHDALYAYGMTLYNQGRFQEAIGYFNEAILESTRTQQLPSISDYGMMSLAFYALGNFAAAYELGEKILTIDPNDARTMLNLGIFGPLINKSQEAIFYLKRCLTLRPDYIDALDGLAFAYATLGQREEAKKYGNFSLQAKDADAFNEKNIAWLIKELGLKNLDYKKELKKFNPEQSHRNVISFPLWGNNPRYTENAIKNAIVAKAIYPGWRCRFYCDDTVSNDVKNKLLENDADVVAAVSKGAYYGLFWRLSVINDPNVDFFLIRDCDALLNCQERVAVDEWLESKTCFHLMHDSYGHSELIQGGMWGGVANLLPNLQLLIDQFYENNFKGRTIDQIFLRYCIWPFVKQSYLDHNSFYTFGNSKDFPKFGRFPSAKWHVGQNVG